MNYNGIRVLPKDTIKFLFFNKKVFFFFLIFFNKQTHTKERENEILT